MKSFNYYKKEIEDNTEMLRLVALEILENIDFSNKNNLLKGLVPDEFITPHFDKGLCKIEGYSFSIERNDLKLNVSLDLANDNITVFDYRHFNNQVSFNYNTLLLKNKSIESGRIDFDGKPRLVSKELSEDIKAFLNRNNYLFDFVYIYHSSIDIEDTIRANSFNYIKELDLLLDIKGTYKNGDLLIKSINLFNIKGKYNEVEKKLESLKNSTITATIIQDIFDVTLNNCYVKSSSLQNFVKKEGLDILRTTEFMDLYELHTSI